MKRANRTCIKSAFYALLLCLFSVGSFWSDQDEEQSTEPPEPHVEDVVYLEGGVIFRGKIVEMVPGESLKLETRNGAVLWVDMADVWHLGQRRHTVSTEEKREESGERREIRTLKVELELNLVQERRRDAEKGEARDGTEAPQALEEEIARLEEELGELQEEQGEEGELKELEQEACALLDELTQRAKEKIETDAGAAAGEKGSQSSAEIQEIAARLLRMIEGMGESARAGSAEGKPLSPASEALKRIDPQMHGLLENGNWRKRRSRRTVEPLVSDLTYADKTVLYEVYKNRGQPRGVGLNLIPGLSLGSWLQRDVLGALVGTAAVGGGIALLTLNLLGDDGPGYRIDSGPTGYRVTYFPSGGMGYAGIAMAVAGYAWSLARPFLYSRRCNRELAEMLGLPARASRRDKEKAREPEGAESR